MDHNNILAVVLAGGESKRFGKDKSQVKLGNKLLIDYILSEIIDLYKDILIVTNEPIKFLDSDKISLTNDIKKAVAEAKAGQVEIRNDKDGNIGLSIGKKSFDDEKLIKNFKAVMDALEKEKSNLTTKGDLVKQVYITSSMGVSYKIKLEKSI